VGFRSIPSFVPLPNKPEKPSDKKEHAAQLIIEKQVLSKPATSAVPKTETKTETTAQPITKIGSLNKIRQQIASQMQSQHSGPIPLNDAILQETWDAYVELLKERQNHSAVTNFKLAALVILDEQQFKIVTDNTIQCKFIESERSSLVPFLQKKFNNPALKYQLVIEEKPEQVNNKSKHLNSKEHYQLLVDQYPAIKELKERLKLDIGY
jgi:DNA polymerase-3 subunit gamma/tau